MNRVIEIHNYWKEKIIDLPEKTEFDYIVKNERANCIIVRNSRISSVKVGIKPRVYEIVIPPNQSGLITRPFPIEAVHLFADAKTPVTIIETITQTPTADYIQQNIARYVDVINTVGLRAFELNRDANRNVGVNIHNQPIRVCQLDAFEPVMNSGTSTARSLSVTLDTGIYARPIVNIYVWSNAAADYHVDIANDPHAWWRRTTFSITGATGGHKFVTFNDNAFRFVRVTSLDANNHEIVISALR